MKPMGTDKKISKNGEICGSSSSGDAKRAQELHIGHFSPDWGFADGQRIFAADGQLADRFIGDHGCG